ncbi:undecaprenyl-phosphate alpha-N-acetylglucosaminyl 1-phosphate transferase, partial [Marinobacter sp. Z-F4-2]
MEAAYFSGTIAAVISLLAVIGLRPVARKIRLVDLPNHRKSHKG